ncbi:MAG: hypothetical protein IJV00_09630 [Clostridia bacterium]|nr:hypothetical protein [Clostridia bacterium]
MSVGFTFLGTCAADFSPRLKTDCADRFDKDVRRASCALINEKFLIDCGPHCLDSLRISGKDANKITDVFMTNFHGDHFRAEKLAALASDHKIRLWAREDAAVPETENVEVVRMAPFERMEFAPGNFVTGMSANHDQRAFPQHLLFEIGDKKIFYGMDGAWLINRTFIALKNAALDMIVLDGTCGDYDGDRRGGEHNTIPMVRLLIASLKTIGAVGENTRIFISHLAPSLHKPHAETAAIGEKEGIGVAYDGLEIKI